MCETHIRGALDNAERKTAGRPGAADLDPDDRGRGGLMSCARRPAQSQRIQRSGTLVELWGENALHFGGENVVIC